MGCLERVDIERNGNKVRQMIFSLVRVNGTVTNDEKKTNCKLLRESEVTEHSFCRYLGAYTNRLIMTSTGLI